MAKFLHIPKATYNTQQFFHSLWQRASAQKVSFLNLVVIQPLSTHLIRLLFPKRVHYTLQKVKMSFCKCDNYPFAVHLYDCTSYKRSLQLVFISSNCFFTGPRYELKNYYKSLHYFDEISGWSWSMLEQFSICFWRLHWWYWKISSTEHKTLQVK